jgi:hypothetical protein
MKCEVFNTVLTFLVGVSVLLGVIFALRTIFHTRELRTLNSQMLTCQFNVNRLNATIAAAEQYGKLHPDSGIERILQQSLQPKPAAR